jgi:hypothetical protein
MPHTTDIRGRARVCPLSICSNLYLYIYFNFYGPTLYLCGPSSNVKLKLGPRRPILYRLELNINKSKVKGCLSLYPPIRVCYIYVHTCAQACLRTYP